MKSSVLIVDDEAMLRRALADRLQHWGHTTEQAKTGDEALTLCKAKTYDVILLDLKLPDMSGLDVLAALQNAGCDADVVVLTAHGSVETAVEAVKRGAAEFLPKPADFELLRTLLERSLSRRKLERVAEALQEQHVRDAPFVVGDSPAMNDLVKTAQQAARANTTLLLRGESGVGKQVIAEHVHRSSARSSGPFVYINCVALSDDLIESTLFGHEKGAFTGALARKPGLFETANGGTAFLDEIGDISALLQTKLLHFLETGEFMRVGGVRTISVDCRIIAATNRNLEEAVRADMFREDLFYRLNVITLEIPPLRERPDDILALAEEFIARDAREMNRPRPKLANKTAKILQAYAWPGNVRQLKNVIERMVVLARTDTLTADLLPPEILQPAVAPGLDAGTLPFKQAIEEFKKQYLAKALANAGGNQTKAATALEMQRTHLNRLIKELGARPDEADPS